MKKHTIRESMVPWQKVDYLVESFTLFLYTQYLSQLHLLIGAVFRYNLCRALVASFSLLDICFAALFYRILASNAFFSLKKMTRYLQATPTYFLEPKKTGFVNALPVLFTFIGAGVGIFLWCICRNRVIATLYYRNFYNCNILLFFFCINIINSISLDYISCNT